MDFQADIKLFSTTNIVFLDVRKTVPPLCTPFKALIN